MATLASTAIKDTYPLLLKIDSTGIDSTLRKVEDGDGSDSSLLISDDSIAIDAGDKLGFDGTDTGTYISESANDILDFYSGGTHMLSLDKTNTEVVINEGSADINFRVEGNGDANLLFCDAGNDRVGIGQSAPTTTLEVVGGLLQQNVTLQSGSGAEDLTGTTGNLIWYSTIAQAGDITLPQATSANAGMVIKIIAGASWSTTAFKLGYASGGSTVMVGTLRVSALNAVLTTSFAITTNAKNLVIDSNAVATAGGAKGSTYTFTYLAANLVHVDANAYITTGTVATTAAASVTGGI